MPTQQQHELASDARVQHSRDKNTLIRKRNRGAITNEQYAIEVQKLDDALEAEVNRIYGFTPTH